jgi:hypothetical protein
MMEHTFASETGTSQVLTQESGSPTGSRSRLQMIGLTLYAVGSLSLFVAFVGFIIGLEGRPYGYLGNFVTLVILSLPILFAGILFFRRMG